MSSATKMKYVVNEALQRYELPDDKHYIVKVGISMIAVLNERKWFLDNCTTWK